MPDSYDRFLMSESSRNIAYHIDSNETVLTPDELLTLMRDAALEAFRS